LDIKRALGELDGIVYWIVFHSTSTLTREMERKGSLLMGGEGEKET
jgi:hypothetical protein